jgi:hypothetical protein
MRHLPFEFLKGIKQVAVEKGEQDSITNAATIQSSVDVGTAYDFVAVRSSSESNAVGALVVCAACVLSGASWTESLC